MILISHRETTFGSQKKQWKRLKYYNSSKKFQKSHLPAKVPIKLKCQKVCFLHKKFTITPFVQVVFLVFIRVFKTVARYKFTYRGLNLSDSR
jgi:hypothetical protein